MRATSATPGRRRTPSANGDGSPDSAAVVTVTSDPFVSWASTLDCAAYVWLNTAVDTANDPVSAMIISPRDSRWRWRDIDAATTPESPWARGRVMRLIARRPRTRNPFDTRHANRADPTHRSNGARKVT